MVTTGLPGHNRKPTPRVPQSPKFCDYCGGQPVRMFFASGVKLCKVCGELYEEDKLTIKEILLG